MVRMGDVITSRLEVRDLTKVYPGGWGLHGVSLTVPQATIVALGGPNGSGKSTLLRCVAGLARYGGEVRIDGRLVDGAPVSRVAIGYLPQTVALPPRATVGEVLALFGRLRGAHPGEVDLPEGFLREPGARIGELSGGQRHRVGLAVALLGRPSLLLLDEPVAALDEEGREGFWGTLRRLRDERGVSAVVSSPSPSDLRGLADRGVYLAEGRLVLEERFGPDDDLVMEACG
jgi:ABC-type multidrug transport system ATPase subunit